MRDCRKNIRNCDEGNRNLLKSELESLLNVPVFDHSTSGIIDLVEHLRGRKLRAETVDEIMAEGLIIPLTANTDEAMDIVKNARKHGKN